jgi:hypothetical protein
MPDIARLVMTATSCWVGLRSNRTQLLGPVHVSMNVVGPVHKFLPPLRKG